MIFRPRRPASATAVTSDRWIGRWWLIAVGAGLMVVGRAAMFFPGDWVAVAGIIGVWLGALVVMQGAQALPSPESLPDSTRPQAPLRARLWRLTRARDWALESRAVGRYVVGALVGFLLAVAGASLVSGVGTLFARPAYLIAVMGGLAAPVFFPTALLGIALCPPVVRRETSRRFYWIMALWGLACGIVLVVAYPVVIGIAVIAELAVVRLFGFDIFFFLLPALGTFAFIRLMLALGMLRRVEASDEAELGGDDAARLARADDDGGVE